MVGPGITGLSVALNGHRQERRQGGPISCSEIRRPALRSRTGIEGGQIAPHDVIDSFSFPFPGFSPDFLQGGTAVSEVFDQPQRKRLFRKRRLTAGPDGMHALGLWRGRLTLADRVIRDSPVKDQNSAVGGTEVSARGDDGWRRSFTKP